MSIYLDNGWRYRNTAPAVRSNRPVQAARPIQPGALPGIGRTNWAQKYVSTTLVFASCLDHELAFYFNINSLFCHAYTQYHVRKQINVKIKS